MSQSQTPDAESPIPAEELKLLAGVEPRIFRSIWIVGLAGTAAFWLWRGPGWAAGFAAGAALSALSFQWMKTAINTLADTVLLGASPSEPGGVSKRRSAGAVARFVLRYALIAVAGYVIFRSSVISLVAFFAGLFVAIAATLMEVAYQVYLSFRGR